MLPKIFLTGATGYIGGSVLHTLYTAHPDWSYTVLLRNIPSNFSETYPTITIIRGTYDSADLLSEAAQDADIVVHNGDSDHVASLTALISGLEAKSTPCYLIHLSGTGIVSDYQSPTYLGRMNPKIWSDTSVSDLDAIKNLPDTALHRVTEKLLHTTIAKIQHQEGGEEGGERSRNNLNITIICPPDIYGRGLGLGKTTSAYLPIYISEIQKRKRAFYHGEGSNTRSWVHVRDLMRVYLRVIESAAEGRTEEWNGRGYYFAGTQEHAQIDITVAVARILKKRGVIEEDEPEHVGIDVLDEMLQLPNFPRLSRYLFASNSRTRAHRAEKLFGYKGEQPELLDCLEEDMVDVLGTE